jgi:hypothetical protein
LNARISRVKVGDVCMGGRSKLMTWKHRPAIADHVSGIPNHSDVLHTCQICDWKTPWFWEARNQGEACAAKA